MIGVAFAAHGALSCGPAAAPPEAPARVQKFAAAKSKSDPLRDAARRAGVAASSDEAARLLQGELDKWGWPGLALGVVAGGELVFERGFGVRDLESHEPVTKDTLFRIGSITKTFTGLAVLRLRDEGKLSLDDPASRFLPELAEVVYPTRDSPPITIRNLVTHTSGLSRDGMLPGLRAGGHTPTEVEVLDSLRDQALDFAPATSDEYSNQAAALTGMIVARVSGVPYADYVTREILAPLGMTSSGFVADPARLASGYVKANGRWVREPVSPPSPTAAAGQIYSSVSDLSRYLAFELAAWPARDEEDLAPVRRSSVRESQLVAGLQRAGDAGHGIFWSVEADCALGHVVFHNGTIDGYHAAVLFLPQSDLGVALLSNAREPLGFDLTVRRALSAIAQAEVRGVPGLDDAASGLRRLMLDPTEEGIRKLYSPSFLAKIPPEEVRAFLTGAAADVGTCTEARALRVERRASAVLNLRCERGSFDVEMTLAREAPHTIDRLVLRAAPRCGAYDP